jgi:hypothetical protein
MQAKWPLLQVAGWHSTGWGALHWTAPRPWVADWGGGWLPFLAGERLTLCLLQGVLLQWQRLLRLLCLLRRQLPSIHLRRPLPPLPPLPAAQLLRGRRWRLRWSLSAAGQRQSSTQPLGEVHPPSCGRRPAAAVVAC